MTGSDPSQSIGGPRDRVRLASEMEHDHTAAGVVIDCDRCRLRGIGCGDCVVTVLLGEPPPGVPLSDEEHHALDVLSSAGLVPPLRMVIARESPSTDST